MIFLICNIETDWLESHLITESAKRINLY